MSICRWISSLALGAASAYSCAGAFSPAEVKNIQQYWGAPGRYASALPKNSAQQGMWQVRLTVSGSGWIWRYNKLRGVGKGAPTNAPTSGRVEWDAWLTAKIAWDRYQATMLANEWNRRDQGFLSPNQTQVAPVDPGPMPQDLILAMGQETPVFANVVKPMAHTIKFEDDEITYADNPVMRPNYAYYRFEQGVMSAGVPLGKIPEADMARIAEKAKINGSIARVMVAISPLEGRSR